MAETQIFKAFLCMKRRGQIRGFVVHKQSGMTSDFQGVKSMANQAYDIS